MKEVVDFLNTLHRLDGNNINTTAESVDNNKFMQKILYKDQNLIDSIINRLKNGGKVLLTGFAGDGKTTIAKLVAEQLTGSGIELDKDVFSIATPIGKLTIIKDLSEVPLSESNKLLYEKTSSSTESLLIVSNTGTIKSRLLSIYGDGRWQSTYESESVFESAILKGIECGDSGFEDDIDGLNIHVFNLVRRDNLAIAYEVFKRILNLPDWDRATEKERESTVYLNVKLLKANDFLALKRMFYIYRRIYEYGQRLTMRNLLEHFAYTITGNLNNLIQNNSQRFFVDNFFGAYDSKSLEIEGIKCVRKFDFGKNIPSLWKRRIFHGANIEQLTIDLPKSVYSIDRYAPLSKEECYLEHFYSLENQATILRMLFLINNFDVEQDEYAKQYINGFLNSPAFMDFLELQRSKTVIRKTRLKLDTLIKDVLSDYCSNMVIPKSSQKDKIYITLSRKTHEINQSAQIVLAIFDWNSRNIQVDSILDSRNLYQFCLRLRNREVVDERMILNLPMLDYLFEIDAGASLANMNSLFQKRLENIKLQLYRESDILTKEDDELSIVYKDIQNKLHEIHYFIENDEIDVRGE